ncbi:hypothetical protein V474_14590 [Novosphingobium barchaimii LL02]|uniref:2-methylthioadenine synthetase n=1 Tax=Novosphingobium barchaimii LL02 TaxID=1114963 RepID=A0A0J7XYS3_9SPHN|nr:SAVED domain-containing protein [Novosphingobium barchaimii]KMS56642.1 hypothetical protein V474_14590 [Novosphingobium barchaimii LL02]
MKHVNHFITSLINYMFRLRSPGLALIRWGVGLLVAIMGGAAISVGFPTPDGRFSFSYDSSSGLPGLAFWAMFSVCIVLMVAGLILIYVEHHREGRKKVLAIELRGLRDTSGTPLSKAVPSRLKGRRQSVLVNLRQGADGSILQPGIALGHITQLPTSIRHQEEGFDRADISLVAAGMAPVPYTFLAGVLIDDESEVLLMDWDRGSEAWRELNGTDDGERFIVSGLDALTDEIEAVVAVSMSYDVDAGAIAKTFPDLPVIHLKMPKPNPASFWSSEKQVALAQQFFDTVRALCGTKVKLVHLVFSATNSSVLRFGRSYDKRNLPDLIVYQYDQAATPPYPWGVRMPVGTTGQASIETRTLRVV